MANPFTTTDAAVGTAESRLSLRRGTVTSAPPRVEKGPTTAHAVKVTLDSGEQTTAQVLVNMEGDVHIPPSGTRVIVARLRGEYDFVLGRLYDVAHGDTVPPYKTGERTISTALNTSSITFNEKGYILGSAEDETTAAITEKGKLELSPTTERKNTVIVQNDEGAMMITTNDGTTVGIDGGTVTIDGGTTKPITDVTASTTKDSDGHVTSVSLNITRTDAIQVP
jgi:hypothetical protein